MAVTWKKVAYADEVIANALLATKGDMIYASAAGVPAKLAIGADDEILRVATDLPNWEAMPAPAAHTLNSHTAADGAVDFNLQEATDLVVMDVANEAGLPEVGIAVAQLCFAASEKTLHICTVAA
uniref:Uncharacterized protein n=1 Tax=viral metagenome TaxID=1070528 RepID=A0A6M3KSN7_9ZZZZ